MLILVWEFCSAVNIGPMKIEGLDFTAEDESTVAES